MSRTLASKPCVFALLTKSCISCTHNILYLYLLRSQTKQLHVPCLPSLPAVGSTLASQRRRRLPAAVASALRGSTCIVLDAAERRRPGLLLGRTGWQRSGYSWSDLMKVEAAAATQKEVAPKRKYLHQIIPARASPSAHAPRTYHARDAHHACATRTPAPRRATCPWTRYLLHVVAPVYGPVPGHVCLDHDRLIHIS